MKTFLSSTLVLLSILAAVSASAQSVTLSGKVRGGSGYTVLFIGRDGATKSTVLRSTGKFSFSKVSKRSLSGASIQLVDPNGRYFGPVVFENKKTRVSTTFSGKVPPGQKTIDLDTISLKSGYGLVSSKGIRAAGAVFSKALVRASGGRPLGAGEMGLVQTTGGATAAAVRTGAADAGADGDRDGIPAAFDVDDDGDLNLDASDPDSAGGDVPYSALYLDFRKTINSHVRSGLTDEAIDGVIGGENVFSLTTFISLPTNLASSVTGGHVICDDSLSYCRRNTPVAFYGGVSESTDEFRGNPWSALLTSAGYPRLERISVGGMPVMVASIQPRVGRDQFRAGDVIQTVLTGASGTISTRTFTVAPYFVSVPALKSYDAGSGVVEVDYNSVGPSSGSVPGTSLGDPIVLSPSGLLTVTFWRPQRAAIRSDESGYYDWGNMNYGFMPGDAQATCAGLFTGVSSELEADSTPLGTGDSVFYNQGANGTPLRDTVGDRAASATNTLTFTVDLKQCLTRAGVTAVGTHMAGVRVAGEGVTGGESAAAQFFYVQVQ